MCGIAGIWGECDEEPVRIMMCRLMHRGPDAQGIFHASESAGLLGHRRLSIMDPTGGSQPIRSGEGQDAIVANGEIYNFQSLRSRLGKRHRFKTRSDSEAALALYGEMNTDCVDDLDGMFAFAIADGEDLFIARDPIGIKPLYCGRRNGHLIFASEMKALVDLAEDVKEFPPGSWFHSRIGTRTYYKVPDIKPVKRGVKEHIALVRGILERSVAKRLMSDVPIGVFLSGGLDSSIIAALARPHVRTLHTFSVGVEGSRDLESARMVARHLDTVHHEYILKAEEVAERLPDILFSLESFDQDLVRSAVPCYFTSRLAGNEVKVILTGEGADELFAGYRYYQGYKNSSRLLRELQRSVQALHNVNLQRVDRMTMAHSIEGRVPFLDVELIELAQTIPPQFKLKKNGRSRPVEKWVLRKAFEDLLPFEIVWREKEQFDEGSGTINLLEETVGHWMTPVEAGHYAARYPNTPLRSSEECVYHKLVSESYANPAPILENVARWSDRPDCMQ